MIVKKIKKYFHENQKKKSQAFIDSLSERSTDFLKEAYIQLDALSMTNYANEFTNNEAAAVAKEMHKRGLQHQYDY